MMSNQKFQPYLQKYRQIFHENFNQFQSITDFELILVFKLSNRRQSN